MKEKGVIVRPYSGGLYENFYAFINNLCSY